jgi:hypothetical protein
MIVDSVNGSTINIVSQNISNPRGTLVWNQAQKTITPWSGYSVVGIVHAPGNVSNGGSDGYFHGTPPDGAVIENHEDGGHKYVAIGGALALIPPETIWGYVEQMHARIPSGQFHEIVWMHSNDIHNIEYGFGGDRSHVPADNSFFYENGSTQQYVIQYRYAFSVGTAEELSSLGGTNRAIMVPPGLHARLAGVPEIPNDAILKAISNPTYYHIVNGTAYWANNFTVIDCIQTVKNGRLQPVPWSLILTLDNNGRINGQPTHCSFPPNWAIYGPGGAERWRVDGANPYVRHRYADPLALHCRLGSFLTQVQLPDVAGINESTEAEPLNCPNNTFVRIAGNGEVYQVVDNVLHYVMSPSALACLTSGHPEVVIDVDGRDVVTAPRGSDAYCSFEGKMVQAPSGRVYFVKGGTRYYVPSWGVLSCLKGRSATGDPIIVDQSTFEGYGDSGATAYCPYEIVPRLNFVQENGDSTVWVVGPPSAPGQPGVKRHAGSLCVPDPYTTGLLQYRISIVPPGETAGHVQGLDFWASGASCQALRQG